MKKLLEWGVTGSQKLDQDIPKRDALKAMKKAEKIGYNEEKKRQARSEKKIKMMEKQEEKAKKAKEKAEEKAKENNENSSATSSRTAEEDAEVSSGEEDPDETKKALWDSTETKNDPSWQWKIDAPEENKSPQAGEKKKKKKKKRLSLKEEEESTDSSDGSIAKNKKENRYHPCTIAIFRFINFQLISFSFSVFLYYFLFLLLFPFFFSLQEKHTSC